MLSKNCPKKLISLLAEPGRQRAWWIFTLTGVVAITLGGLIAAAVAHNPSQAMVWMVAYIVLILGVAQAGFGIGQAALSLQQPSFVRVAAEYGLFNLGSLAVIYGRLSEHFTAVLIGDIAVLVALWLFYSQLKRSQAGRCVAIYRGLVAVVALGALVGLILSAFRAFF